ncbi:YisL family protein [Bacillaceae bacterium Marseille-Q3522]|nr:YisL family protein [Bacillaceae bacterium Marseille-Q3522]
MTHAHITTWLLAIILFFVAIALYKNGKEKGSKIIHMILRLDYLLIIITGVMILFDLYQITWLYVLKSLVGLWIISVIEMILIKTNKGKKTASLWGQFIVALLLVLYLGFSLPLNFDFF